MLVLLSLIVMLAIIIIIVVVVVCRRPLRVGADAVTAVNVSHSSGPHDDVERLLPTGDILHQSAGSVDDDDDDDDDELHRSRDASSSSGSCRLDFDVTRRSLNSRRCVVETDEVDSERVLLLTVI